jgi:hypothetical protein
MCELVEDLLFKTPLLSSFPPAMLLAPDLGLWKCGYRRYDDGDTVPCGLSWLGVMGGGVGCFFYASPYK